MQTKPILSSAALILVSIAISLCVFMQVLDYSIANVCVPYIAGDLGVSKTNGTWVITMFAAGNATALPLTGWLTDRWGSVRVMILSTLLFTIFSFCCGIAPTFEGLILARFFQGISAGPLIPLSQSLMVLIFPDEKRNMALAIWNMVALVGPVCGPILGGYIVDISTWPWIFLINIPVGIFALTVIKWNFRGFETNLVARRVDIIGFIFLAIAVTAFQILIDQGQDLDWMNSPTIRFLAITAFLAYLIHLLWELTDQDPLIKYRLFKDHNFALGTIYASISYAFIFGAIVITPLWLQSTMNYTALWAGLAIAPMGIPPVLFVALVARLLDKGISKWLLFISYIFFCLSFAIYSSFTTEISFSYIASTRLVLGMGVLFWLPALLHLSFGNIATELMPSATGIFHFFRVLSGGVGTSFFVTLWQRRESHHQSYLSETIQLDTLSKAFSDLSTDHQLAIGNQLMQKQAYMLSANDVYFLPLLIFAVLLCGVIAFKRSAQESKHKQILSE